MPKATDSVTETRRSATSQNLAKGSCPDEGNNGNPGWRPSTIPRSKQLVETYVIKQYRLDKAQLDGLPYEEKPCKKARRGVMRLYRERDVERVAWEQHGGPDGFEAYLRRLRDDYRKRYPDKEFCAPQAYGQLAPSIVNPGPVATTVAVAPVEILSLKLRALKEELHLKAHGDSWLWELCDRLASRKRAKHKDVYIEAAVRDLKPYPPRPGAGFTANSSPTFIFLEQVLGRAPGVEWWDSCNAEEHVDWDGELDVFWTDAYFTEVFRALMNIMKEHGLAGWKDARWMVYDTFIVHSQYHNSMGTVKIEEGDYAAWAEDDGYGWLQEYIDVGGSPPFRFNSWGSRRSDAWKEFAALLNTLTDQEAI